MRPALPWEMSRRGQSGQRTFLCQEAALVCPAITFTIVLIMTLLHNPLFGLFGLGAEAMMYTKYMLIIYLFFGAVRTCCYIQNECFRAGGEAIVGTVMEIGGLMLFSVPAHG